MDRRSPTLRSENPSSAERFAALDLGSNMFRLVVGCARDNGFEVLEKAVEVVSIGRDVDAGRRITDSARERAEACLARFRGLIERHGVMQTRSVATAAFRKAENGREVAETLSKTIGCEVEVIAPAREAGLAFSGATGETRQQVDVSILDIGGASTEYVARVAEGEFSTSMDVGVISLHERVPGVAGDRDRAARLERSCRDVLSPLRDAPRGGHIACYALGGAAVALAAFRSGRTYEQLLGASSPAFTRDELARIHEEFVTMPLPERARRIGVSEAHAELVFAGYWILHVAMEYVGADQIVPTGRGVAEGLLSEMVAHGG